MQEPVPPKYRWFMLALLTAIGAFVTAIPVSCMPVLFKEISEDLGLSLVQVGSIWGIASLAGLFVSIIAGVLSDRLGMKLFLGISCLLVGLTGALRGVSDSFFMLALTVFLNGVIRLMVPVNVTKTIGIWFKGRNLGLAMGVGAMGMGFGLMLGPMISATVLSPWLGGWRNVMYFYGGVSAFVGVLWLMFGRAPDTAGPTVTGTERVSIKEAFSSLMRNKAVWFLGLMLFFRAGSIMGLTGYIPLYLRGQGWAAGSADAVLGAFYAISTICVVPLSSLSDKLGSRKTILLTGLIVAIVSIGLVPFVDGAAVWLLVMFAGIFMDAYMAVFTTLLLETEGVGQKFSGLAVGVVFTIAQLGSVISPPIGNSLAELNQALPFIFWAILGAAALIPLFFIKETGRRLNKLR